MIDLTKLLDLTKPKNMMMLSMSVAMIMSVIVLSIASPAWVQKIDITGKVVLSWKIILSYSLTFALACGVISLLVSVNKRGSIKVNRFPKPSLELLPSNEAANAYAYKA